MATPLNKKRFEIKRLVVLATLTLGWNNSLLAETLPQERAVQPLEEVPAHENDSSFNAARQVDQHSLSERADDVEVDEIHVDSRDRHLMSQDKLGQ